MDKYETSLFEYVIKCDDISLYPYKLAHNKITYAGEKMGERKEGCYLKVRGIKTGKNDNMRKRPSQIAIELVCDEYHVEDIYYNSKPHSEWLSQGKIFVDLKVFKQSLLHLVDLCDGLLRNEKEEDVDDKEVEEIKVEEEEIDEWIGRTHF